MTRLPFLAPLQALTLIERCGVARRSVVLMLLLALAQAAVDALSALLFAVVLAVLLRGGLGMPGWLGALQLPFLALPIEVLLAWLVLLLTLCKAIVAPFLGRQRGRLVDQWSVRLSMAALKAELGPVASGGQQVHAQGRNITVNFTVTRVIMGAVFPTLDLLTELLVVVVLLGYLAWHLPLLGVALLCGLLLAGVVSVLRGRFRRHPGGLRMHIQEQMHRWVTDSSDCLRELQLYGRIPAVLERYQPLARDFAQITSQERAQQDTQGPIVELALLFMLGGAVFILHHYVPQTELGAVALCSAIGLRLLPGLRRILMAWYGLGHVQASVVQLHELLDRAERLSAERHAPAVMALPAGQLLVCSGVCYGYPGTARPVLNGIDLRLERGEWLGLVGESGAGKSTFVDLLIGRLQPAKGDLAWAGPVAIGYVGVHTTLMPGTLRDNVLLFGQTASDSELMQIFSIVGLAAWLMSLSEGLDTPITQIEHHLSGGERQRLGLARAVVHARDLLILDEATAALDEMTERGLLQALKSARPDLAVLLITHRLSALRHTARAVLLANGQLGNYQSPTRPSVGSF